MKRVQQEDAFGCGLAVLAMLTGTPYAEVRDEVDAWRYGHDGDWSKHGTTHYSLDRYLIARGFYLARRYDIHCDQWPPEPFAPVHFASVQQPSGHSHFVVMDADGVVLDPLREGRYRLTDWAVVNNVVGLVRPDAPDPR